MNNVQTFHSHLIKSKLGIPICYMHKCIESGIVIPVSYSIKGWVFCLLDVYLLVLYDRLLSIAMGHSLAAKILHYCIKKDAFNIGKIDYYKEHSIEIMLPIPSVIGKVHINLLLPSSNNMVP